MPLKLLAIADMHLGRRPSRLPGMLADRARSLGPAAAWGRAVAAALAARVDAVALAGDVVEGEHDFFEAYRELHRGVERLMEAGIRVLGVVGNHDAAVLPRLAEQIGGFELLGAGGRWQSARIAKDGETLTLWGWSFPGSRVSASPLQGMTLDRGPGPNLGLLHCDREQVASPYAPVTGGELAAAGLDGWLLGHIHRPDGLGAPHPSGYLGSITGTDPGEPGARGPWLVEVHGGRVTHVEQWALAPLRWQHLEVDIEGITDPEQSRARLLDAVRALDADMAAGRWPPEAVGLRLTFAGRSRFGQASVALLSEEDREHVHAGEAGTHYFVERLEAATRPEIQLEELAQRRDPPGLLARRLLLLERAPEDPQRRALLADARPRLDARARDARWSALKLQAPDDDTVADRLQRAGLRLLDAMLAQREVAG